ncbi:MAG TPA: hypothetical protein VL133_13800, partial [Devosia sp.]|nr:hypothetical protein [Devosia sp.]
MADRHAMELNVNQLGLLDYILIVLSIIFSWRLQQRAQPPPTDTQPLQATSSVDVERVGPVAAEPDTPLHRRLKHICIICGYDDIASFVDGAKLAYEMVVQAFAAGNIADCAYLL